MDGDQFSMLNLPPVKLAKPRLANNAAMPRRDPDEATTDLGLRIKARRVELGWNQDQLATRAGVTKSAVSQWETGNIKTLQMSRVVKVADALGVEIRWLVTGDGIKLRAYSLPDPSLGIDEAEAIKNLRAADPAYRRYVISLALMSPDKQQLMVQTMREAVPDSVVEAAYGRPPAKKPPKV